MCKMGQIRREFVAAIAMTLTSTDINHLTPIGAINLLHQIKNEVDP